MSSKMEISSSKKEKIMWEYFLGLKSFAPSLECTNRNGVLNNFKLLDLQKKELFKPNAVNVCHGVVFMVLVSLLHVPRAHSNV